MDILSPALAGILGVVVCCALIQLVFRVSRKRSATLSARQFHHDNREPVSRFGGIALCGTFLLVALLNATGLLGGGHWSREQAIVILGSVAMFALGLWDDFRPLGARRKFVGQLLIAGAIYTFGLGIHSFKIPFQDRVIDLGGWSLLVTMFWLVAITNLINLIDGADGLAGGLCLMLMFLLAYVSPGDSTLVLLSCGLAGALGGFLWFNFPPARIYMGDGGAYFLGCFIAASTISSSQKGTVMAALVAPMFVLALPILDTSLAILRRGLRGLPIFRPDRRHIHHHLQEMGFSRRKVVLSLYVFTLVFLLLGMAAFTLRGQWIPILAGVGILLVLYTAGKLRFSREWFAVGRMVGNSLSMRGEVRYALIHTQWLRLEAHRASSMDVLWQDLVFVAQKLGFNGLRLQLEDAERSWQSPEAGPMRFRTTHRLRCGQTIALELTAGQNPEARESDVSETRVSRLRSHQEQIKDKKLFLILAELLAECFDKTLTVWSRDHGLPLCFDPQAIPNRSESETLPGSILAGLSPMTPRPKVKS